MGGITAAKQQLRREIIAARAARPTQQCAGDAESLAERLLELPELRKASTVAAYVSIGDEPGTWPLLDALLKQDRRVLLPVVLPDLDLEWAELDELDDLRPTKRGLLEPTGPALGVNALTEADVAVCPGLAADLNGVRLGRGAGCYDRALSRCGAGTLRCLLLYDNEVLGAVPRSSHDELVDLVITPSRALRLR